ncbi:TetR/AcrR family transcriptional regulator [Otariodibacter oris]|uniref:TetR family transcriptional regulator n=1 Tax=Otariodibacter oris TaxID=1032623 RepID=A0A420XHJ7_9PAST|nr:TetR/AcrR family transcriptional regulator [Otariodibacter oris]QGM81094.1 AcrR family transcriptional regulator [Otariodibacter oris]RKR76719.1 TetR family transcriptional regulator [Otariodibacter oris]
MLKEEKVHNEVALRILKATDTLMARYGVQHLSTHKIAKEAGVSVGTIYLYFKDKEDLLTQFVVYLFGNFHRAIEVAYQPDLPLFDQYQYLWKATWRFMLENPNIVKNMHQYESLPQFRSILKHYSMLENSVWNKFVKQGQKDGVILSLPSQILFLMSMKTAWQLMYSQLLNENPYSDELINTVINSTWKAIIN